MSCGEMLNSLLGIQIHFHSNLFFVEFFFFSNQLFHFFYKNCHQSSYLKDGLCYMFFEFKVEFPLRYKCYIPCPIRTWHSAMLNPSVAFAVRIPCDLMSIPANSCGPGYENS